MAATATARKADGSAVTGRVFGRIVNRSGVDCQPLIVQTNPVPYAPATLDTTQARLVTRLGEYTTGVVTGEAELPSSDWAWGRCSAANPFPGTFDVTQPMHICVRGGFDPAELYMVTYTAKDAYVLGIGFAAFRDLGDFFRNAQADAAGVANPVAQRVTYSITRGNSQSGNYLAARLHMGFNETESGRLLHDGLWPIKFSRHRPTANRKCSSSKAVAQGPAAHVNTGCGPYVCRSTSRAGPADPDQSFDFSFWAP